MRPFRRRGHGLIYPGPAVGAQRITGTRRGIRWLVRDRMGMGMGMDSTAAVSWPGQCCRAETARHEGKRENRDRCPGANRSLGGLRVSATSRAAATNDDVP
jgi:hypothetical protein